MAFWQYSFWAIPEKNIKKKYGNIPKEVGEEDFNSIAWFDGYSEWSFLETIDYLSSSSHWSNSVKFFGDLESDCIAIDYEDDKLCEIFMRIDLTKDYALMAKKMMGSVKISGLLILDEELKIINDSLDEFISRLEDICDERNKSFER